MRSGNSAIGSIGTGLITTGIAQLARYYNIPSRGPGGVTDSKVFDIQNGFERLQTLLLAAQAGINYITCAGTYEATLVGAFELLAIDNELAGMILRAFEGITVNEDTIALDVIKKVATSTQKGSTFLGEKHTLKHMRKELFFPKLLDRNRRATWRKKGSKDIMERAREQIEEILNTQKGPGLSSEIEAKLVVYTKMVSMRTFEEYQKLEGIISDSVTLPDGIEVRKEGN
jgi:trimethylamine--corrinoid protein Co-methyltransferase